MADHTSKHSGSELPCADKLVFDTRRQAAAMANVLRYQRGTRLRPYICRYCHLWHLSTDRGGDD